MEHAPTPESAAAYAPTAEIPTYVRGAIHDDMPDEGMIVTLDTPRGPVTIQIAVMPTHKLIVCRQFYTPGWKRNTIGLLSVAIRAI